MYFSFLFTHDFRHGLLYYLDDALSDVGCQLVPKRVATEDIVSDVEVFILTCVTKTVNSRPQRIVKVSKLAA